jgi:hypothetical protein
MIDGVNETDGWSLGEFKVVRFEFGKGNKGVARVVMTRSRNGLWCCERN